MNATKAYQRCKTYDLYYSNHFTKITLFKLNKYEHRWKLFEHGTKIGKKTLNIKMLNTCSRLVCSTNEARLLLETCFGLSEEAVNRH